MPPTLQALLDAHLPADAAEAHFTASALVVDVDAGKIALLNHAKLRRWLQSGGHAEPVDQGLMHLAALREARAETGCEVRLHEAAPSLIDVDIHPIPGN
jgi:8-oxo-dGTP pyrophosphatase MutT (NUDIX family)